MAKCVNHVVLHEAPGAPRLVLSAGVNKTACVWAYNVASGEYAACQTVKMHKGEATGLFVHLTSTLKGLASLDWMYSVHSLTNFTPVFQSAPGEDAYAATNIHLDRTLLVLGTPGLTIQNFDSRSGALAATLMPEAGTPFMVSTLAFSENGYHLLVPDSTSSVVIWDLYKQVHTTSINLGESFKVNKVMYDISAQFSGSAGGKVFAHKTWEELATFEEGGEMSDIVFGTLKITC